MAVYYLGFFTVDSLEGEKRQSFRASAIPMQYITDAIKRSGHSVVRIAAGKTLGKTACPEHILHIDEQETHVFFKSCGRKGPLTSFLGTQQSKYELIRFFLRNVKKGDTVIVYHSLFYLKLLFFLRSLLGFRLVLEVAELYSDVRGTEKMRASEIRYCSKADAYLFFSDLLEELINVCHKPYAISHGTYFIEPLAENKLFPEDGVKHLVYAGTFSRKKGGAAIAASVAAYLPADYHIHILGSGTEEDVRCLQEIIDGYRDGHCAKVTLDGCLAGSAYIQFLQSCDVGLSTQNSAEKFNHSSFPSKVTSYLSNGLRVVSTRIPVLERSALDPLLYYYEGNDPREIAEAVMSIDWQQPYDSRSIIRRLDEEFVKSMGVLLKDDECMGIPGKG